MTFAVSKLSCPGESGSRSRSRKHVTQTMHSIPEMLWKAPHVANPISVIPRASLGYPSVDNLETFSTRMLEGLIVCACFRYTVEFFTCTCKYLTCAVVCFKIFEVLIEFSYLYDSDESIGWCLKSSFLFFVLLCEVG